MNCKSIPPRVVPLRRENAGWVFFAQIIRKIVPTFFLFLMSGIISAQTDSLAKAPTYLNFSIEKGVVGANKSVDTLDIMLATSGYTIAGVDLKIGFDSYALEILEVLRGELLDSCNWEFFDTKASIDQGKEGFPRSIWQVVMLSEFIPDSVRPICYSFKRPVSIARLVVSLNADRARIMPDTLLPIYFFWEDCSDNTVTNVSGDSLMMSLVVDGVSSASSSGAGAANIQPPVTTPARFISFPSRLGAPDNCINPRAINKPTRKLVFQSGGVRVGTVVDK